MMNKVKVKVIKYFKFYSAIGKYVMKRSVKYFKLMKIYLKEERKEGRIVKSS